MSQHELRRIGNRLTDPESTSEERAACYEALRNFSDHLKVRDLERRSDVVIFSIGVKLSDERIAHMVNRSSLADFCIRHGLTRAEVLERTGLAQAGVS